MRVCQFRHSGTIQSSAIGWIGSNSSVQKPWLMSNAGMSCAHTIVILRVCDFIGFAKKPMLKTKSLVTSKIAKNQ
jgi:hypothetical protein